MTTTAADNNPEKLWLETPLVYSLHISARLGCNVYLKLEHFQPTQSFKCRGVSYFVLHARRTRGSGVRIIIASSGNSVLAAAYPSKALSLRCTVYLPAGTDASTIEFMHREGAEVVIAGEIYLEAKKAAQKAAESEPNAIFVPAYDNPLLWEDHSSMVAGLARQLPNKTKPDAVFCNVGGGGLCVGVMLGCKSVGWDDVPIVALGTMATIEPGASVRAEHNAEYDVTVAHLPALTSRAMSLGAGSPAAGSVRMALDRKGGIKSVCLDDELAMHAGLLFSDEHKILAELACSTTLVPAYSLELFAKIVPASASGEQRTIVFVVCGGFKTSLTEFEEYRAIVENAMTGRTHWTYYATASGGRFPQATSLIMLFPRTQYVALPQFFDTDDLVLSDMHSPLRPFAGIN